MHANTNGDSRTSRFWLPALGLFLLAQIPFLASCTTDSAGAREIRWELNDSLKNYAKVVITLVDAKDSSKVLDTVFTGKLDPKNLPVYRVPDSITGDYRIVIQGFNEKGELSLQSTIAVKGGVPSTPEKLPPEKLPGMIGKLPSARLVTLEVSSGILSPEFQDSVFSYTVEVAFETESMQVNAVGRDSGATVNLGGNTLIPGVPSFPSALKVGENKLVLSVTPKGGSIPNLYTITINRGRGDESRLASLDVSNGNLSPSFHADTLAYTLEVAADQDSLLVNPKSLDPKAVVTIDGDTLRPEGFGKAFALASGKILSVEIRVTSVDHSLQSTYTIKATRRPSPDATLKGLSLSNGNLSSSFDPNQIQYTATVNKAQISVIPLSSQKESKITVDGKPVASGAPSPLIDLNIGVTAVLVVVTAPDTTQKKSYSLFINRASPNALLSKLTLDSAVPFDSAFTSERFHYKATVPRTTAGTKMAFQAVDLNAKVTGTINGQVITGASVGGATGSLDMLLKVGMNEIEVVVTAADKVSKTTYSVSLLRQPGNLAELITLSVSPGILRPAFSPTVTGYADTVANTVTSVILTAKARDTAAIIIVRLKRSKAVADTVLIKPRPVIVSTDTLDAAKSSLTLGVLVGANIIELEGLAEDRTTRKIYTVVVQRRPSSNSQLASLTVGPAGGKPLLLTPAFDAKILLYQATTTGSFVSVTPTAADSGATITVNGKAVASGKPSASITLVLGTNSLIDTVTAQDGKTKTVYTVRVQRNFIKVIDSLVPGRRMYSH